MAKKIFLFVVTFLVTNIHFYPQELDNVNTEFNLALNLYESLQYEQALNIFERIAIEKDFNRKTTIAYLFTGKTLLNLERYDEAIETLKSFVEKYSESEYLEEAYITLAKGFVEKNEYKNAMDNLAKIVLSSDSLDYINYAKDKIEKIALNYLIPEQIDSIYKSNKNEKTGALFLLTLAKSYRQNNELEKARDNLLELMQDYPDSPERETAAKIYQEVLSSKKNIISSDNTFILAMLPLSGLNISQEHLTASKEILEGIKFAVAEFNDEHDDPIGLVIKDTKMDNKRIEEIKNIISAYPEIQSIIGPLFSIEVRTALEKYEGIDLPIISPTATDNDLTKLNESFFQANPNFERRGRIMAQYIYYVENKRKMAVLNAIDGYSPILSTAFINEFSELGGEVVMRQTYKSNSFTLEEPVSKLAEEKDNFEGLYIPVADKIDVPAILSKLVQHGINIPIYGNQDWFPAKGYETSSELSNQLIFTSDYFIDFNNPAYIEFNKMFVDRTGLDANRNVLYGYDTAKYLLSVLRTIEAGSESTKMKMKNGFTSTGFHNNISFGENRINRFLNIVRYRDGQFELIDKFKGG